MLQLLLQLHLELQLHLLTFTITIRMTVLMQILAEQWDQEAVDHLDVVRAKMEAEYTQDIAITINDI